MMFSEGGGLRLADSRTALTGYHRRNCGFCPARSPFFGGEWRSGGLCQKGAGREGVFFVRRMLEQYVVAPAGSPYLQWLLSNPVTSSKGVPRGAVWSLCRSAGKTTEAARLVCGRHRSAPVPTFVGLSFEVVLC